MVGIILGAAIGGFALIGAVYGAFRKFTRLTWIGWQILIAFALSLLVSLIPVPENKAGGFALYAILFAAVVAIPLAAEYFLRKFLLKKQKASPDAHVVLDRVGGSVTAALASAMFVLCVGGVAISMAENIAGQTLIDSPVWTGFFAGHVLDLFQCALFMIVMRAGCRLGALKGMYCFLIIALLFLSFFASFLLASRVDWGISFSKWIGSWFGLQGSAAAIAGSVGVTFFFTLILAVGIMFLSKLLDWSTQKALEIKAVSIPDALIVGVLFTVVFLLAVCGINALFSALSQGNLLGGLTEGFKDMEGMESVSSSLSQFGTSFVNFIRTSPLSRALYDCNPFIG